MRSHLDAFKNKIKIEPLKKNIRSVQKKEAAYGSYIYKIATHLTDYKRK